MAGIAIGSDPMIRRTLIGTLAIWAVFAAIGNVGFASMARNPPD